jgi:hypothetical protein
VVVRDYVLTHIVDSLARLEPPAGLVFKGGTPHFGCASTRASAPRLTSISTSSDSRSPMRSRCFAKRSISAQTRSSYNGSTFLTPTLS